MKKIIIFIVLIVVAEKVRSIENKSNSLLGTVYTYSEKESLEFASALLHCERKLLSYVVSFIRLVF
jgi:hypothetical protein